MKLIFAEAAWEDYLYWQHQDRRMVLRINKLILETQRYCPPHPARLSTQSCAGDPHSPQRRAPPAEERFKRTADGGENRRDHQHQLRHTYQHSPPQPQPQHRYTQPRVPRYALTAPKTGPSPTATLNSGTDSGLRPRFTPHTSARPGARSEIRQHDSAVFGHLTPQLTSFNSSRNYR